LGFRVVVASDKFKHALSAEEACEAIALGVRQAAPEAEVDRCPMADGGEGTAEAVARGSRDARWVERDVAGPSPGQRVTARMLLLDGGKRAVLDMSSAAGLSLVSRKDRNPVRTTSFGVGEMIAYADDLGCRSVVVGLGGSATCDGGLGAAQALGLHLYDDDGELTGPCRGGDLVRLRRVDVPAVARRIRITCLCDVTNPLLGASGAARVFAPQKGASAAEVEELEHGLLHAAQVCDRLDEAATPGTGAAGGLAFGLMLAGNAVAAPGAAAVADVCGLNDRLAGTQLAFTGEGRFDRSSLDGKVPGTVARLCRRLEVPCVVLAGGVDAAAAAEADAAGIDAAFSIIDAADVQLAVAERDTADLLSRAAEHVTRFALRMRPQ
jgi:glycerate kinase